MSSALTQQAAYHSPHAQNPVDPDVIDYPILPPAATRLWDTKELRSHTLEFLIERGTTYWRSDFAKLLSLDKKTFDDVAALLYEEATLCTVDGELETFDVLGYLRSRGCSEERLNLYASYVQRVQLDRVLLSSHCIRNIDQTPHLLIFPNLRRISFAIASPNNDDIDAITGDLRRSPGAQFLTRLSLSVRNTLVLGFPLHALYRGPDDHDSGDGTWVLEEVVCPNFWWSNHRPTRTVPDWILNGLKESILPGLHTLDLGEYPITHASLKRVLAVTPCLMRLNVWMDMEKNQVEPHDASEFEIFASCPRLTTLKLVNDDDSRLARPVILVLDLLTRHCPNLREVDIPAKYVEASSDGKPTTASDWILLDGQPIAAPQPDVSLSWTPRWNLDRLTLRVDTKHLGFICPLAIIYLFATTLRLDCDLKIRYADHETQFPHDVKEELRGEDLREREAEQRMSHVIDASRKRMREQATVVSGEGRRVGWKVGE